jgi:hypothetical protein
VIGVRAIVVFAALAFAAPLANFRRETPASSPAGESVATGPHYRVSCNFKNDAFAAEALAIAEATWDESQQIYGPLAKKLAAPRVINIYRAQQEYEEVEYSITGGKFKDNGGFSSFDTGQAYLTIHPPCSERVLARIGMPYLTKVLIVNEASHLVRYETYNNFRHHPIWLDRGAEMWLTERMLRRLEIVKDPSADPDFSTRLLQVRNLARDGRLPAIATQLKTDPIPGLNKFGQYSIRWVFFRSFATESRLPQLRALLTDARRMDGGDTFGFELSRAFQKTFAPDQWQSLDADFKRRALEARGEWWQSWRHLDTSRDEWIQIAFPDNPAVCWRSGFLPRDKFEITGEMSAFPDSKQLHVLIGNRDTAYTQVTFSHENGRINYSEFDSKRPAASQWKTIVRRPLAGFTPELWHPFKVTIRGTLLEVVFDDRPVIQTSIDEAWSNGTWGLGTSAGTPALWRNVRARAIE